MLLLEQSGEFTKVVIDTLLYRVGNEHWGADRGARSREAVRAVDQTGILKPGVPPQDPDGGSSLLTLHFVAALRDEADLDEALGQAALAAVS